MIERYFRILWRPTRFTTPGLGELYAGIDECAVFPFLRAALEKGK